MAFVLDASVTACWAFRDEDHSIADAALARLRAESAIVPSLWWFEVRNILVANERRKRLEESETDAFLRDLSRLPVALDVSLVEGDVLRLARKHKLTVYDASYLEVALRNHVDLATLDAALQRAARVEQVGLIGAE